MVEADDALLGQNHGTEDEEREARCEIEHLVERYRAKRSAPRNGLTSCQQEHLKRLPSELGSRRQKADPEACESMQCQTPERRDGTEAVEQDLPSRSEQRQNEHVECAPHTELREGHGSKRAHDRAPVAQAEHACHEGRTESPP